ncbi:hypothetical protein J437_LFUL000478 [Ladona fulva]|uniref:Dynein heavy chain n=1 Tax=Ladona fulva TaxID=123851 RepID=A0A8K0KM18_LADFU|nr:hypothetical protein J437_LFUL000478 [Ladona fulva]
MLLVRSLRPDRISFCITKYIMNSLGSQFIEPPVLDLHSALDDSNAFSPLIFILSPGVDPSMTLLQLAESVGMEKKLRMLSLGQGQSSVARSLIHNGLKEGDWVYLANCHLSMSWMPELDKIISENILSLFLSEYEDTPWDALKYLIAGINYGGHVTDEWDRRLLNTYINYFFKDEAINTQFYRLSSLPLYYIPRDGSLQSYKDYIAILPNVDSAEVFGQHPNADITSLISETRGLFETLLSLQVQTADSASGSKDNKVIELCNEVLVKLPEDIDYEACDRLTGKNKSPLDVVFLQEISSYNLLLTTIKLSLVELQKGMKGLIVMSSKLEEIYFCMNDGRVPNEWMKVYPSLKLLGSWVQDLIQRVDYFSQWAVTLKAPVLFWLGAFTFPSALLTAVLQISARQGGISVDTLTWEFNIVLRDETLLSEGPEEGIYVHGLYLEGAGWDWKNACLIDPLPMQLISVMPVVHFKPVDQYKKKQKGIYICPTYYYPNRSGEGTRPSFVIAVELKSGSKPSDYWIKHGTALLLSLS